MLLSTVNMQSVYNSLRLMIKKLAYKLGIHLWHFVQTNSMVNLMEVFLHNNCSVASIILKTTYEAPHMSIRHPYRLAWKNQALKIEQYFSTHYWMICDTTKNMCCSSINPCCILLHSPPIYIYSRYKKIRKYL